MLAREPGTHVFRELDAYEGLEPIPGTAILRLDGGLFFATSDALADRVRDVALETESVTSLVLDFGGIDFIDSQGTAKINEIAELARSGSITLRLARVKPQVRAILARDGCLERIGEDRIHGNVDEAVSAKVAESAGDAGSMVK